VLPKDKKHIAYNKEFKVKTTKSLEVLKAVLTNLSLKLKGTMSLLLRLQGGIRKIL
jgi:hypothetical protein